MVYINLHFYFKIKKYGKSFGLQNVLDGIKIIAEHILDGIKIIAEHNRR